MSDTDRMFLAPYFRTRIAGRTWYDVGSDVNWIEYGGMWARPAGPDAPGLWYGIRFHGRDEADLCGWEYAAVLFEITPSEVSSLALRAVGLNGDAVAPERVAAAMLHGEGRIECVTGRHPAHVRATASRYLLGEFIPGTNGDAHRFHG